MDGLYLAIKEFLDSLFPSAIQSTFGNLNELIAIMFTYGFLYTFIVKPIFYLFKPSDRKRK